MRLKGQCDELQRRLAGLSSLWSPHSSLPGSPGALSYLGSQGGAGMVGSPGPSTSQPSSTSQAQLPLLLQQSGGGAGVSQDAAGR